MRRFLLKFFALFFLTAPLVAWAQAPTGTPLTFISMSPCRVLDTRTAVGPFGGPFIAAGTSRTFELPNSTDCHIPTTASAYSLNVTVVPHGSFLGYLTVWPTGVPQPLVSSLNSFDGRFKANAVVVGAGTLQSVDVFASDDTDVVFDIDGYFVDPTQNDGLQFYPIVPCNVVNTTLKPPKPDNGLAGPSLSGGTPRKFPVSTSPCLAPYPQAQAYSLNVTAIPKAASLGYLTVWPSEFAQPVVSTLNAPTGTTTTNAALVYGATGNLSAFASDNADVIIDANGFFAEPGLTFPGPPIVTGLSLYTQTPCRVLDTRTLPVVSGVPPFAGPFGPVDVVGSGCVASPTPKAYIMNVTALPTGKMAFLNVFNSDIPTNPIQNPSTVLTALDAQVTSNMKIVTGSTTTVPKWEVSAYAASATQLILDLNDYFDSSALTFLNPAATTPNTTDSPLMDATATVGYSATLLAQGGEPPYTWAVGTGTLPTGLTLDANLGVISGVAPTSAVGTNAFTLTVTDSSPTPVTISQSSSITVDPFLPLVIGATTLPNGAVGVAYDQTVMAVGGVRPYSWAITSGALPNGLTLSTKANAAVISGIPGTAGTSTFVLQVTDAMGSTVSRSFTIVIK
jgi:hypothetical protein